MTVSQGRVAAYVESVERLIAEYGFAVQGVFAVEKSQHDFAYTIGLTAKGLPEAILYGLPVQACSEILNDWAQVIIEGGWPGFMVRARLDIPDTGVKFVAVDRTDTSDLSVARRVYGDGVTVKQIVWPDDVGRYPWESDFAARFADLQPIPDGVKP